MKILNIDLKQRTEIPAELHGSCMAIGSFDGIHRGHMELIRQLKECAVKAGRKAAILTFEPHPILFFRPDIKNYRITPFELKKKILEEAGIDWLVVAKFDENFARLSAEVFVEDFVIGELKASEIYTGEDFKFGHKRLGNATVLETMASQLGYKYNKVTKIESDSGVRYSSTGIRGLIVEGNVEQVDKYLGRNYVITGKVVPGKQEARILGFKTANVELTEYVMPKFGVYDTNTTIDGKTYRSIANIGTKPTYGENTPILETHLFGFDQDIYGKEIAVEFLRFIREEKKFGSVEELKAQIQDDISKISK